MKIGLISGQRIPNLLKTQEKITVETSYGTVPVELSQVGKHTVFFINRHGEQANLPPHKVNYQGNIEAFASSHADCIFAVGTVGSLKTQIKPGDFVLPHNFIDFTKGRPCTFFDDQRVHVDMTSPYCPVLRTSLIRAAKTMRKISIHDHGVYLATEGPRLETASEIMFFSQFSDVVGMTGVPEVVLAREKGICYVSVCVVSNMATGLQSTLTANEIRKTYTEREPFLATLLETTIRSLEKKNTCTCTPDILKAML